LHLDCLAKAGAGSAQRVHRDVAFVEVGNEFRTKPSCGDAA